MWSLRSWVYVGFNASGAFCIYRLKCLVRLWLCSQLSTSSALQPLQYHFPPFRCPLQSRSHCLLHIILTSLSTVPEEKKRKKETFKITTHLWGRLGILLQRGNAAFLGNDAVIDGIEWTTIINLKVVRLICNADPCTILDHLCALPWNTSKCDSKRDPFFCYLVLNSEKKKKRF